MLRDGLDFHVVRAVCKACGWHRVVAHSGTSEGRRALVKLSKASDPSHVIEASVVEVAESMPTAEWKAQYPEFSDLVAEAHDKGLMAAMGSYSPLFDDRVCPRCKGEGRLELDQLWYFGRRPQY